jgi:hypothetical protein
MVQVEFAATSTADAENACAALVAVMVGAPQFTNVGAGGLAMLIPAFKVSEKLRPVRATLPVPVLAIVKVSVVIPVKGIFAAPNALDSVGRDCTVKFAVFEAAPVGA